MTDTKKPEKPKTPKKNTKAAATQGVAKKATPEMPKNHKLLSLQSQAMSNTASDIDARNPQDFDKAAQAPDAPRTFIAVDLVDPNPYQPRIQFDAKRLNDLADSIREVGLIHPIAVRLMDDGRYQLIAGERRLRATKLCEKTEIMAVIFEVSDKIMSTMAIIENIERERLSDYELALQMKANEHFFESITQMAAQLNKQRTDIYKYYAFLELPVEIRGKLDNNAFLFGRRVASQLTALFNTDKYKANQDIYDEAIRTSISKLEKDGLAVSLFMVDVERRVREIKNPRRESPNSVKSHFHMPGHKGKKVGTFVSDDKGLSIKIDQSLITGDFANELAEFIASKLSVARVAKT